MANFRNPRTQLRVNCPDIVSDIDALEPVISQYAASPHIIALLVKKAALLDRPAGVGFGWYQHDPAEMFGFAGQNLQNFNNGIFTPFEFMTPA